MFFYLLQFILVVDGHHVDTDRLCIQNGTDWLGRIGKNDTLRCDVQ
jgi:hypothetical protein